MPGNRNSQKHESTKTREHKGFTQHQNMKEENNNKSSTLSLDSVSQRKVQDKKNGAGFTLVEVLVTLAVFSILGVAIIDVFLLSLHAQRQTSQRQKALASLRYVTETIARQVRTSEIDYLIPYNSDGKNTLVLRDLDNNKYEYRLDTDKINFIFNDSQTSPLTNPEEIKVIKLFFYVNPLTNPFIQERCNENSDCLSYTLGCNLLGKICQGGGNNGKSCNDAADCPDGECFSPSFKSGFCLCNESQDCVSTNCGLTPDLGDQTVCLPFNFQPRVTMVLGFQSVGLNPEEQKTIYLQTTVSSRVYKR